MSMRQRKRVWLRRFGWAGHIGPSNAPVFAGWLLRMMEFDYGQRTRG